ERALPLNDHIHLDLQLDDETVVGRPEPREQTSLRSALTAAVPGSGARLHVKLHTGSQAPRRTRRQPPTPRSSAISPAGGGRSRPEELHGKSDALALTQREGCRGRSGRSGSFVIRRRGWVGRAACGRSACERSFDAVQRFAFALARCEHAAVVGSGLGWKRV